MQPSLFVRCDYLFLFQPHCVKEGLPAFLGAEHQRMGETFRCCTSAIRLHLQLRERHCGASHSQPVLRPGGVQRGPAGHAEGP